MKHWFGLAALICFGSTLAHGQTQTYDIECDTVTAFTTTVTSYTTAGNTIPLFSASLQGATTTFATILPSRKYLEISNVDTSSNAICNVDVNQSTTPASWLTYTQNAPLTATVGKILLPNGANPWRINLPPFQPNTGYPLIPICMSTSANPGGKSVRISVTQCGSY